MGKRKQKVQPWKRIDPLRDYIVLAFLSPRKMCQRSWYRCHHLRSDLLLGERFEGIHFILY